MALDTLRVEVAHMYGLIGKVGTKLGVRRVPELNLHVPKAKRAKRTENLNSKEFHELLDVLDGCCCPETDKGEYVRDWSLGAAKARRRAPKIVNQDLGRSRQELLRWFVLVAASSGYESHELAGDGRGSLRWRGVEFKMVEVVASFLIPLPRLEPLLFFESGQ
ncbi:MAG: hypothetical protein WCH37_05435 [Synechococcaceae cyanobacterium ELA182]